MLEIVILRTVRLVQQTLNVVVLLKLMENICLVLVMKAVNIMLMMW